jgi:hypothetical protein
LGVAGKLNIVRAMESLFKGVSIVSAIELANMAQLELSDKKTSAMRESIRESIRSKSRYLHQLNFTRIHENDLRSLFELYDGAYFDGKLAHVLKHHGWPLAFRLSSRMTRAGGKTTRTARRTTVWAPRRSYQFEIAVSTTLLFETFRDPRSHLVAGVLCHNRLDALMRIFEHELLHLMEFVLWNDSNCSAHRFRTLARGLFSHRESNHQLITPQERAVKELGIKQGDYVSFQREGRTIIGRINRITRRATVLVIDPAGEVYSDGCRYVKYYVPLSILRRAPLAAKPA